MRLERLARDLARAADVLLERVQQRHRLESIAARRRPRFLADPAAIDPVPHQADHQRAVHVPNEPIAEHQRFRENCGPCRCAAAERVHARAQTPLRASHVATIESLPPEKSSTGRSNWAAISRKM